MTTSNHEGMYYPVIVRPGPEGRFTAVALGAPEIRAEADTAETALEQVREALTTWSGSLAWVPVGPPAPRPHPAEPWIGHAKDDPDHDLYLDEIRRYREEVDRRECSSTSSTPTT